MINGCNENKPSSILCHSLRWTYSEAQKAKWSVLFEVIVISCPNLLFFYVIYFHHAICNTSDSIANKRNLG